MRLEGCTCPNCDPHGTVKSEAREEAYEAMRAALMEFEEIEHDEGIDQQGGDCRMCKRSRALALAEQADADAR